MSSCHPRVGAGAQVVKGLAMASALGDVHLEYAAGALASLPSGKGSSLARLQGRGLRRQQAEIVQPLRLGPRLKTV